MRWLYLLLCLLGAVLPLAAFAPWLVAHGPALGLLLQQATGTPVAAFAWADVLVSALVLLCFMAHEQRQRPVARRWLVLLALLCVGVSLAFPLYLYLRDVQAPGRGRA